jgi:hypothetical protein
MCATQTVGRSSYRPSSSAAAIRASIASFRFCISVTVLVCVEQARAIWRALLNGFGTIACMRVLLVGDTHANTMWLENVVLKGAESLNVDAVCQLGDFGYWPSSPVFLETARKSPVPFFFLDGNHEHFPTLYRDVEEASRRDGLSATEPVCLGGNLWYLPRGARLVWGGVRVGVLGGANSIDRGLRTRGVDWFEEEAVTSADVAKLGAGGLCQVLLTHDAPAAANLPMPVPAERAWLCELAVCERGRETLNDAVDAVQPELVVHGHYHRRWVLPVTRSWGSYQVVGLSEDGSDVAGNLALLECENGEFSLRSLYELPA